MRGVKVEAEILEGKRRWLIIYCFNKIIKKEKKLFKRFLEWGGNWLFFLNGNLWKYGKNITNIFNFFTSKLLKKKDFFSGFQKKKKLSIPPKCVFAFL